MRITTCLTLCLALILCFVSLRAQDGQLQKYTTADGLPQNTVGGIIQDNKGFLWMTTPDGLARFDGYDFQIWRADFGDTNALKSNGLTAVLEDAQYRIWICTGDGGLSRYNPASGEWRTYLLDSSAQNSPYSNSAFKPMIVGDTALWYLAGWTLQKVLITNEKPKFSHFTLETELEIHKRYVFRDFDFDGDKTLWIASPLGMLAFDLVKEEYLPVPGQLEYPPDSSIISCRFDHRGDLWISPFRKPARIIRKENLYPGARDEPNPYVPAEFGWPIMKMKRMSNGQMFLMGEQGLYTCNYQEEGSGYRAYYPSRHLMSRLVWDAFIDTMDNLWIGTETGLYCDFASQGSFEVIRNENNLVNTTYRIYKDSKNHLWFGGLNEVQAYIPETGEFQIHTINEEPSRKSILISGILEDEDQKLWIAASPDLIKMDRQSGQANALNIEINVPIQFGSLGSFIKDSDGVFWMSHANGITRYNPVTDEWRSYEHEQNTFFTSIAELDRKTLVMVGKHQLHLFDKESFTVEFIPWDSSKPNKYPSYLQLAKMVIVSDNKIMIGAKNGLFIYDPNAKTWRNFTTAHGLPSNVIRALAADTLGRIWMSTNHGIAYFDMSTERISTFNPQSSIGCLEFNSRAVEVDESGVIYFGCDQGVLRIDPTEFVSNQVIPSVEFTSIAVFNKDVKAGTHTETSGLPKIPQNPEYLDELVLDHKHSVFTIGFSALNFFENDRVNYRHRLKGFENEWLEDGTNRSLTYTNLDPGNYTLEVQASNNFGYWGEAVYQLPIVITPPWYGTLLAKISMVLIGSLLAYSLLILRFRAIRREERVKTRINAARMQEREDFRRESAADFHDEAGNKITKINLFTELAHGEAGDNSTMVGYLKGIEDNTKALSSGMRDFLWVMDPDKDTLFDTIYRLQRFGDSMFNTTRIKFNIEGLVAEMQDVKLPMQARKAIIQIFREGIHNCLKHSEAGEVTLEIKLEDENLCICLEDNGKGFNPESHSAPNHYGIKIMQKRAESVGAEFNILSSFGKGCRIEFKAALPHLS